MGHFLPDARDCRVSWAMLAEVARWGTTICPRVGVSCLMSYPASRITSVDVCSEGDVLAHHLFFYTRLRFSDTDQLPKLNTDIRICRTKFGIITLILKEVGKLFQRLIAHIDPGASRIP